MFLTAECEWKKTKRYGKEGKDGVGSHRSKHHQETDLGHFVGKAPVPLH